MAHEQNGLQNRLGCDIRVVFLNGIAERSTGPVRLDELNLIWFHTRICQRLACSQLHLRGDLRCPRIQRALHFVE